jgi:uncharacterized damage-inducible protein DinB
MPTLVPAETDERDGLLKFLDAQRGGLRRAVLGLTEEQATTQPSSSSLTLAGLIKHVARTEEVWVQGTLMGRPEFAGNEADYVSGFQLLPDEGETLASVLARYDAVARATEETVNSLPDLEVTVALPEAPWYPPGMKVSARWILLHLIEEVARHAGHADIVRESLDGRTAFELAAESLSQEAKH